MKASVHGYNTAPARCVARELNGRINRLAAAVIHVYVLHVLRRHCQQVLDKVHLYLAGKIVVARIVALGTLNECLAHLRIAMPQVKHAAVDVHVDNLGAGLKVFKLIALAPAQHHFQAVVPKNVYAVGVPLIVGTVVNRIDQLLALRHATSPP